MKGFGTAGTLAIALLALWAPPFARAGEAEESRHLISTGAGIASPSANTSLMENPAGLSANRGFKLLGFGAMATTSSGVTEAGAGLLGGNGSVGGGIESDSAVGGGSGTTLTAGLGAELKALNTSFGLACGTTLGSTSSLTCSDFGLIYNAHSGLRVGVQALTSGSPARLGAGVAGEVGRDVTLALDAAADSSGNGLRLKPGLAVHLSPLQLAVGYGFTPGSGGASANLIRTGTSVGLEYQAGKSIELEGYYNQLSQVYASLVIRL